MTLDLAYERIHGMRWKLDGVDGRLAVERINGMTEVVHYASAAGRRTKQYRETRRELGDDYSTRLNDDGDAMCEIFARVWSEEHLVKS